MEMNILALDLGTKCGFAIWKDGSIISGTKKLQHNKKAFGLRFLDFRRWLIRMIEEHNICMLFFERVHGHKGTDAAHCFGGFMYTLAAVCEELAVKCTGIPVGTIKKFATGKGNATKKEMVAFAKSQGFTPVDDNESDALAILFLSLKTTIVKNTLSSPGSSQPLGESGSASPRASLASEVF
ncbi:hypothetical protein FACS1894122_15200 [Alphaproteobacteria bacterium]|nr:hypothetical protein FACS1894122_15200 [Alphaproteobacteria bacterium]